VVSALQWRRQMPMGHRDSAPGGRSGQGIRGPHLWAGWS